VRSTPNITLRRRKIPNRLDMGPLLARRHCFAAFASWVLSYW
jgi:hypothetical protein